jgi:hypothetical protein
VCWRTQQCAWHWPADNQLASYYVRHQPTVLNTSLLTTRTSLLTTRTRLLTKRAPVLTMRTLRQECMEMIMHRFGRERLDEVKP